MKKEIRTLSDLIKGRPTLFDDLKSNIGLPSEVKALCKKFSAEVKDSAIVYYELSDYQIALDLFKKAILLDNQDDEVFYYMSKIYIMLEDKLNAYDSINNALTINSKNEKYLFQKTDLLLSNIVEADFNIQLKIIEDLLNSINLCDENAVDYYNFKSQLDYHNNNLNSALDNINKVLELKQDNYDYYDTKAEILIKEFNFEEALVELYKAIELSSDENDLYYKRSKLYFRLAMYKEALEDIIHASKLYSDINPGYCLSEYDDLEFEINLKLKNYDKIREEIDYLNYENLYTRCFNEDCLFKECNEDFDISKCSKNYDCEDFYEGPSNIKYSLYCHYKRLSLALNKNYFLGENDIYRPKGQYFFGINGIEYCLKLHEYEYNKKSDYHYLLSLNIHENLETDCLSKSILADIKGLSKEEIVELFNEIEKMLSENFYSFAYIVFKHDVLSVLERYDDLYLFLDKMLKLFPYDDDILYLKLMLSFKLKKLECIEELIGKIKNIARYPKLIYSLVEYYIENNQEDKAIVYVNNIIPKLKGVYDQDFEIILILNLLISVRKYDKAWSALQEFLIKNEEFQELILYKAYLLYLKSDYDNAFDEYKKLEIV